MYVYSWNSVATQVMSSALLFKINICTHTHTQSIVSYFLQTVTFQTILLTNYLSTYYVTIYQDGKMNWNVPMSSVSGSTDHYVARVGTYCKSGDTYTYDFSQLPYAQIAQKSMVERISEVYQAYTGFDNDADDTLLTKRQTQGAITYSNDADDSLIPAYAKRGMFVFVLNAVTSHPVLECHAWLDTATAISNKEFAEICPAAKSQLIPTGDMIRSVVGDYEFYFIPTDFESTAGVNCGYLNIGSEDDGSPIAPGLNRLVEGANLYRCVVFYSD